MLKNDQAECLEGFAHGNQLLEVSSFDPKQRTISEAFKVLFGNFLIDKAQKWGDELTGRTDVAGHFQSGLIHIIQTAVSGKQEIKMPWNLSFFFQDCVSVFGDWLKILIT